jgi:hypothetical protein
MTLRTMFAIPIAIILLVTLVLAGMIASQGWATQTRSRAAVAAVEHMRLLLRLETDLRAERVATNFVLGKPYPLAAQVKQRLIDARHNTDRRITAVDQANWENAAAGTPADWYLATVVVRLGSVRATIDGLLAVNQSERSFAALDTMMPRMVAVARALDDPLDRASLAVTTADPSLAGLLTQNRLAASLRDQVGAIAALVLPRFNAGQRLNANDLYQLHIILARTSYLTRLIADTIEVAGATDRIRASITELKAIDTDSMSGRLNDMADTGSPDSLNDAGPLTPQRILVPWGEQINTLRSAILDAAVAQVASKHTDREMRFAFVLAAFGAVLFAVAECVVLLRQRVVGPLSQLGLAITRIAGGDRSVPVALQSGMREINEMVTAVETLRRAALVADATASRQRMEAQHRLHLLREALGIVQTVQEPAHALERGVTRLSEGFDATIAFVAHKPAIPPATLGSAADAIRAGLAELRESAAELDATFAAAGPAQTEDRPEAEFVAHILAVRAQVDRRSLAVRGFIQPSLVALRDAAGDAPAPVLRDLIGDQFERIEEMVATVASMLAAVTRASAILRDLPLETTPLAA